jgi:hypothetical protein
MAGIPHSGRSFLALLYRSYGLLPSLRALLKINYSVACMMILGLPNHERGGTLLGKILNTLKSNDLRIGFIELLILVLGLFMGFQLDRWNEERRYISQLAKDLQADLEGSKIRIEYLLQVQRHGQIALALWDGVSTDNPRDMVVSLYQASQIYPFFASSATYEDLKSTGNMDLVGDASIRSKLFLYYNSHKVNLAVVGREAPYRMAVRGVIPFQVQEMIRGPCAYLVPGVVTTERLTDSCNIELEEGEAMRILAAIRQHPSLQQQLHQKLGQDMILMEMYKSQMAGAQTLMTALNPSGKRQSL